MVYWSILELFVVDYSKMYQLCIVHMNARCNECAGISTVARLRCNCTAKRKRSKPNLFLQLLFT